VIEAGYILPPPTSVMVSQQLKRSLFDLATQTVPFPYHQKPQLWLLTDFVDANLFKQHFEQAQQENAKAFVKS
jgi:hypothetical protein